MAWATLGTSDPTSITEAWFWVTSMSAGLCAALSAVVVVAGWRRRLPEVGLLGTGLLVISVWMIADGLLSPGPLFAHAQAGPIAMLVGFPAGLVATVPLMFPRARWAQAFAQRWRVLSISSMVVTGVGVAALLARPDTAFDAPRAARFAVVLVTVAGASRLVARQWYLHRIARTRATALAAVSIAMIAAVAPRPTPTIVNRSLAHTV